MDLVSLEDEFGTRKDCFETVFAKEYSGTEFQLMPREYYNRGWGYLTESEPPPMEYFNYLQNTTDRKLLELYQMVGEDSEGNSLTARVAALETGGNGALKYMGSVENYSNLPTDSSIIRVGDTYNVTTSDYDHGIKAGDNVFWNGTGWDNLSGGQELDREYITQAEIDKYFDDYFEELGI